MTWLGATMWHGQWDWGKGRWSRREVQKEMTQCKEIDTTQFGGDEVPQVKGMVNSL